MLIHTLTTRWVGLLQNYNHKTIAGLGVLRVGGLITSPLLPFTGHREASSLLLCPCAYFKFKVLILLHYSYFLPILVP